MVPHQDLDRRGVEGDLLEALAQCGLDKRTIAGITLAPGKRHFARMRRQVPGAHRQDESGLGLEGDRNQHRRIGRLIGLPLTGEAFTQFL